jgi:hypothetical protein
VSIIRQPEEVYLVRVAELLVSSISRGQVVMISKALRGGELMDDGMKDGSGLFLVRLACDFRDLHRPPGVQS